MGKYDDIINLPHHVSKKHPQMPIADRAAQFAPFAALTGYGEQIKETARTTEEFHQISGREKEELDQKLQILQQTQYKHPLISIYYFAPDARKQGGHYNKTTGCVKKIDVINEKLMMIDGNEIAFKHIKEMKTVDEQKLISSIYTHNSTNYKTTVKPIQPFTYLVMDTDNVDDFSWKMNLPAYIDAPLKQGAKVGTVDLLYQGNVVGSVDMVTTEEVTEGFNLLGFLHKLFFS